MRIYGWLDLQVSRGDSDDFVLLCRWWTEKWKRGDELRNEEEGDELWQRWERAEEIGDTKAKSGASEEVIQLNTQTQLFSALLIQSVTQKLNLKIDPIQQYLHSSTS